MKFSDLLNIGFEIDQHNFLKDVSLHFWNMLKCYEKNLYAYIELLDIKILCFFSFSPLIQDPETTWDYNYGNPQNVGDICIIWHFYANKVSLKAIKYLLSLLKTLHPFKSILYHKDKVGRIFLMEVK